MAENDLTQLDAALHQHEPAATLHSLCDKLRADSDRLFLALDELPQLPSARQTALPRLAQGSAVLAELEPLLASNDRAAHEPFETHRALLLATMTPVAVTRGQQIETFDGPASRSALRKALTVEGTGAV